MSRSCAKCSMKSGMTMSRLTQRLLGDDLIFRRTNGAIHHKADYLQSLETGRLNPYELLETSVVSVYMDVADGQETAVTSVRVRAKRKDDQYPAEYSPMEIRGGW
jgi:hypothetical protein